MRATRAGRRALVLLAALCPVLATAGCGVPQASAVRLEAREVPFGLLDPAERGGAAAGAGGGPAGSRDAQAAAAVLASRAPSTYLLDADGALVPVPLQGLRRGAQAPAPEPDGSDGPEGGAPRRAVGDEEAATVAAILLRRLNAGPSADQREEGLSTALGPGLPVRLVEVVDGTARVNLSQPDRDPSADRLPLAVGQAVLTVTSAPGVERVELLRDGEPTEVPLPGLARSAGLVEALDYAVLLAAAR